MTTKDWSRRRFLQGAGGVSIALPLFHPRQVRAQAQSADGFPLRLALFFVAEGYEETYWFPKSPKALHTPPSGFDLKGTTSLGGNDYNRGLEGLLGTSRVPAKERALIVKGLDHASTRARTDCYHNYAMPHILTGGPASIAQNWKGVASPSGISIDRFVATHIKDGTAFPSYELGAQILGSTIQQHLSFDGANRPRPAQPSPYRAFTDLLGGRTSFETEGTVSALHLQNKSVLDLVVAQLGRLRCAVGADGGRKLDAHLTGLREIEKQLVAQQTRKTNVTVNVATTYGNASVYNANESLPAVVRLQSQIAAAALATDLTRVVSIQNMNTVSRAIYRSWLNVPIGDNHHDAVSHNTSAAAIQSRKVIYGWWAEMFKNMMDQLDQYPEGGGTMLDNTLLIYLSEMSIGNQHGYFDIPTILAGAKGKLKTGYLDLTAPANRHRPYSDLWTTVANIFGIAVPKFGEDRYTTGPIPDVLA